MDRIAFQKTVLRAFALILMAVCLMGCGRKKLDMPFSSLDENSPYRIVSNGIFKTEPFSEKLCIVSDVNGTLAQPDEEESYAAAALFDVNRARTVYSQGTFKRLYPASMTKVMTAICAMKYSDRDAEVVCSENVKITESGAQLLGFEPGDKMTMDQAMHALLMYSANDAAVAIAETIAGSVDKFADLMNEEAALLGCQNTHFVNPHGLHEEDHYTTAYDMYLMFNEAIKYDWFTEIIGAHDYASVYTGADGQTKNMELSSTNLYIKGDQRPPEGVEVTGGKTGTTMAAGNNLVLLSHDSAGNPYISIVMRARERGLLYKWMNRLLEQEGN